METWVNIANISVINSSIAYGKITQSLYTSFSTQGIPIPSLAIIYGGRYSPGVVSYTIPNKDSSLISVRDFEIFEVGRKDTYYGNNQPIPFLIGLAVIRNNGFVDAIDLLLTLGEGRQEKTEYVQNAVRKFIGTSLDVLIIVLHYPEGLETKQGALLDNFSRTNFNYTSSVIVRNALQFTGY